MQSYYDITNPDAAYEWLYSVLDMKRGDFISDYVLESRNDFDTFFDRHLKEAERLDIDQLELVAIHVTTNGDDCAEIKKNGLKDLQKVLQEETELNIIIKSDWRILKMNVTSSGIVNGVIQPQYGGHGTQFNVNGISAYSLPFTVEDAPQGTVSIAIVLEDKDAYPVTGGFAWIHWLAADIARFEVKENESQTADDFVQGRNSWTSIQGGEQSAELSCYYGGMTPPDKPHIYELHVYALDKMLDLERGFLLNELYREMDEHILDQFTLKGIYEN